MGGAFALIFSDGGKLLLLAENRAKRKYVWDLPGGTLVVNEKPLDGLRREVREETGLDICVQYPFCHLKWDWHESNQPILVAFYLAEASETKVRLSSEHEQYRWVSEQEIEREQIDLPPGRDVVKAAFELQRVLIRR